MLKARETLEEDMASNTRVTVILARFLLGECLLRLQLLGVVLSVVGVVLISAG
jgi:drug/metabolite transporter (DMT)-like permease